MEYFSIGLQIVGILMIFPIANYLHTIYLDKRNSLHLKKMNRVTSKINHPSSELLELIGKKEFNSILLNDRGAFIVLEKEKND